MPLARGEKQGTGLPRGPLWARNAADTTPPSALRTQTRGANGGASLIGRVSKGIACFGGAVETFCGEIRGFFPAPPGILPGGFPGGRT